MNGEVTHYLFVVFGYVSKTKFHKLSNTTYFFMGLLNIWMKKAGSVKEFSYDTTKNLEEVSKHKKCDNSVARTVLLSGWSTQYAARRLRRCCKSSLTSIRGLRQRLARRQTTGCWQIRLFMT